MLLYRASREAVPLFALYALLFAEHGLGTPQIGTLLVVWSVSSFVLEVPSGAWADLVDRRLLLVLSGLVYAAAFTTWLVWPTYTGFALGFLLWSLSSATMSGTFEAYLFDELTALGRAGRYGVVRTRAEASAVVVMALALASAAPLHRAGGFALVGWTSVGLALVHTLAAATLPPVTRRVPVARGPAPEPASAGAWFRVVRTGVGEAARSTAVRRVLGAYATVVALVGLDEFFPLLLDAGGAAAPTVAWVLAGISLLQAAGTWAADRVARLAGWRHAAAVSAGGLLLAAGAWTSGPVSFAALGLGYALASAAYVAGDVRLQHAMSGGARATTTSTAGLVAEVGFLVGLAALTAGTLRWELSHVAAVLALVVTVPAAVAAHRAPAAP